MVREKKTNPYRSAARAVAKAAIELKEWHEKKRKATEELKLITETYSILSGEYVKAMQEFLALSGTEAMERVLTISARSLATANDEAVSDEG